MTTPRPWCGVLRTGGPVWLHEPRAVLGGEGKNEKMLAVTGVI